MGLFSGIVSSVTGGLLGGAASEFSAKQSYRYDKKTAIHSPSWHVEGLKRAGLNPILAAGSSPSFGSSPQSINVPPPASSAKDVNTASLVKSQKKIAENQAIAAAADAGIKVREMKWNDKVYDFMENNPGFLLKMSSAKKSGVPLKDLGEAGLLHLLLDPNSAKDIPSKPKPKKSAPEYMGIPIWR